MPAQSRTGADWQGRRGRAQEAVLADDLSDTVVYACGSDAMIHSAREHLQAADPLAKDFLAEIIVASN